MLGGAFLQLPFWKTADETLKLVNNCQMWKGRKSPTWERGGEGLKSREIRRKQRQAADVYKRSTTLPNAMRIILLPRSRQGACATFKHVQVKWTKSSRCLLPTYVFSEAQRANKAQRNETRRDEAQRNQAQRNNQKPEIISCVPWEHML